MPRRTLDFDTVRKLACELGEVEELTTRGSPAIKVHGKLLAWIPIHKSAEPGSLAVRLSVDDRAELIAASPDIYYLTDHYLNYSTVLVRLSRIKADALKDLLRMAWAFVAVKSSAKKRRAGVGPVQKGHEGKSRG
jgi:hypothetical protein